MVGDADCTVEYGGRYDVTGQDHRKDQVYLRLDDLFHAFKACFGDEEEFVDKHGEDRYIIKLITACAHAKN